MFSRNASTGFSAAVNSKFDPVALGVQRSMIAPTG
jgi:hypothetical protein